MWTRRALKNQAKDFLKKFYLQAFVVALIIALVTAGGGSHNGGSSHDSANNPTFEFEIPDTLEVTSNTTQLGRQLLPLWMGLLLGIGGVLAILAGVFFMGIKIFVGGPLEVGGRGFFVRGARENTANMGEIGLAFRQDHYLNVVWVMFYRAIINFLYFLLLIIPGIVKAYSFSMVPYLLAENPQLDAKRAIEISEDMTHGHKLNMLILDISFAGWYILGLFFFGIGRYLVYPYVDATKAQLYLTLKEEALRRNLLDSYETL